MYFVFSKPFLFDIILAIQRHFVFYIINIDNNLPKISMNIEDFAFIFMGLLILIILYILFGKLL